MQLFHLLPEMGCEEAHIEDGHDFQLPMERSFLRRKDGAELNMKLRSKTQAESGREGFSRSHGWRQMLCPLSRLSSARCFLCEK